MQMKMFTSWGRTYFEINQWLQKNAATVTVHRLAIICVGDLSGTNGAHTVHY
jgi:hypothetical protein